MISFTVTSTSILTTCAEEGINPHTTFIFHLIPHLARRSWDDILHPYIPPRGFPLG